MLLLQLQMSFDLSMFLCICVEYKLFTNISEMICSLYEVKHSNRVERFGFHFNLPWEEKKKKKRCITFSITFFSVSIIVNTVYNKKKRSKDCFLSVYNINFTKLITSLLVIFRIYHTIQVVGVKYYQNMYA